MKIAVMADDFTGANDIGARLREHGLSVVSTFECGEFPVDVTIVDTETRNAPEKEAYEKARDVFINMKNNGFDYFYKKIDSTLRGNIKAEFAAILENIDEDEKIYVIPAFPEARRLIINGTLFVKGIPLHESEFSRDPVHPMTESSVDIITGGEIITLKDIKEDIDKAIEMAKSRIVVFETSKEEDLKKIAKALVKAKKDRYIAGAAGIMRYLPEEWGICKNKILILSGSCNGNNIEQLNGFIEKISDNFEIYDLDVTKLDEFPEIKESGKDIIVRTIREKNEMCAAEEYFFNLGFDRRGMAKHISEKTAKFTNEIIKKYDIRKIIVTGGETSAELLKTMDIMAMNLASEIQIGVPLMNSLDMKYALITKPGGFGDKNIFFRCYEKLKYAENRVRQNKPE